MDHLNLTERRQYVHIACLDVAIRNRPQPEALYQDPDTSDRIVVERKNFMWPLDYAERHAADHVLRDLLVDQIGPLTRNGPYSLAFPGGVSLDRKELHAFAEAISMAVIPQIGRLVPGGGIAGTIGKGRYVFRLQHDWERDDSEPSVGLGIEIPQAASEGLSDPTRLPKGLAEEIQKCFRSCSHKFAEYQDSRRVLLIEQFGDMRYLGAFWWSKVVDQIRPPTAVSEIWVGEDDVEADGKWTFELLYPTPE